VNSPTNSSDALLFDVDTLINVAQADNILWLSAQDSSPLQDYQAQKAILGQNVTISEFKPSQIETVFNLEKRFDMAIVHNFVEHIEKHEAVRILARLRDFLCPQYCLSLTLDDKIWQLTDLFALGLSKVSSYTNEDKEIALFKYSISSYKRTPDWLNADNWANPQMWGKYWW